MAPPSVVAVTTIFVGQLTVSFVPAAREMAGANSSRLAMTAIETWLVFMAILHLIMVVIDIFRRLSDFTQRDARL